MISSRLTTRRPPPVLCSPSPTHCRGDSLPPPPAIAAALPPILSSLISTSQPPRNPWKCCPSVLDEDTYMATIEKIIKCDFFPDIPKLCDRLNWLEAIHSGDPVLIRDAQLKIHERHATIGAGKTPFAAPDITATNNRSQPLGSTFFPAPSTTPFSSDQTPTVHLLPLGFSAHSRSDRDVVTQPPWPHRHRNPSTLSTRGRREKKSKKKKKR